MHNPYQYWNCFIHILVWPSHFCAWHLDNCSVSKHTSITGMEGEVFLSQEQAVLLLMTVHPNCIWEKMSNPMTTKVQKKWWRVKSTDLREVFLKEHAIVIGFLGAWCVVRVHMDCICHHKICHLHIFMIKTCCILQQLTISFSIVYWIINKQLMRQHQILSQKLFQLHTMQVPE